MNAESRRGLVSLVGAGPGDPGLIAVAGLSRVAAADVIIYDRLVNPALLRHAKRDAELIDAGKAPKRHTLTQEEINELLVEHARAGKFVVRLKGGDPFVFGRGGEEAAAMRAAGVRFEVIPGVTSAIAAPAYAGIPVTHRGVAASFTVVTAHEGAEKPDGGVDWAALAAGGDTLVILMGMSLLAEIATTLIAHGRSADTAAAVIEWGTLPRQRVVAATLATVAREASAAGITNPAVIVVGDVVALREELAWFDAGPLAGRRVLVTRTREQASELARALAEQGAEPIELPALEILEISDAAQVHEAIAGLRSSAYRWCIFTSQNAVDIFVRELVAAGADLRAFGRTSIAAIGPGTDAALARHGLRADVVPERFVAEGLIDALAPRVLHGQRVLIPRAEGARDALIERLEARGAIVDELLLYRAAVPRDPSMEGLRMLRAGEIDIATFASSSAVRNLVAMLDGDVTSLRGVCIAVIGPVTAQSVRDAGLTVSVEAVTYTIDGLVDALVKHAAASANQ